jgi:hypothetical protein
MAKKSTPNRARDFVQQCRKQFETVLEQAQKADEQYIVNAFCLAGNREWRVTSLSSMGKNAITFQAFDGTTQTITVVPVENVVMYLGITKRKSEEKQPEIEFKEMGFHTLMR